MTNDGLDLTNIETFTHFTSVSIRFSDQDSMGHVNNVAFATYVEAARTMFIQDVLDRFDCDGLDFILARVVIDYRRELHYPGIVDVGARFVRLGSKSVTTGYGIFNGDECVATSESVNVFYDMNTRQTVVPPGDVSNMIKNLMTS